MSALCRPLLYIMDLLQREHHQILARIGVGYGKQWLSAYKSRNIWETAQDIMKITINCLYKVGHEHLLATKMYDIE